MSATAGHVAQILLDQRNVSAAFREVTPTRSAETADSTNFASGGWRERVGGVTEAMISAQGLFDSTAGAEGMSAILDALQGVTAGAILTVAPEGLVEGKPAVSGKTSLASTEVNAVIGDVVATNGEFTIEDYAGIGLLLRVAQSADETAGSKTSYDLGWATTKGGRAVAHRTAGTGAWEVRVQHSVDNSVWADIATLSGSGSGAVTATSSATTVNRYLRVNVITQGTGSRFVIAFMRG